MNYLPLLIIFLAACGPRSTPAVEHTAGKQVESGQDGTSNNHVPGGVVIPLPPAGSQNPDNSSIPMPADPNPPTPTNPPPPVGGINDVDAKLPNGMSWVAGNGSTVPDNAVFGSNSTTNPVRSYVCRAQISGAYIPGSLKVNGKCYVGFGSSDARALTAFQLLVYSGDQVGKTLVAINASGSAIPVNALGVGYKDGRTQYLCFVYGKDDFFVGTKDTKTNGCLYADFSQNKDAPEAVTAISQYLDATIL